MLENANAPWRCTVNVLDVFRDSHNAREVAAGDSLFRRGEPGDVMYVILEGRVDVTIDDDLVESLEPGAILGEMALVSDRPRSANATAAIDSRVVPVDKTWFTYLIRQTPTFGLHVMSVMAERLRRFMELGHEPHEPPA